MRLDWTGCSVNSARCGTDGGEQAPPAPSQGTLRAGPGSGSRKRETEHEPVQASPASQSSDYFSVRASAGVFPTPSSRLSFKSLNWRKVAQLFVFRV